MYYEFRTALMIRNNEGLTKTYNRFHDPNETSPDIVKLRELHAAMDRAVLDAYGWTDLQPTCEFLLDYEEEDEDEELTIDNRQLTTAWMRTAREEQVTLDLPERTQQPVETDVPKSNGLRVVLSIRPVSSDGHDGGLPQGVRSVSVFLVNRRTPAPDVVRDEAFAFQTQLEVACDTPLVPRPNLRSLESDDWDERVADLQYRDAYELAVGHSVAAETVFEESNCCRTVRTCWIPQAEVERVAPVQITGVELSMEAFSQLADGADAKAKLGNFVAQYRDWIRKQRADAALLPTRRKDTAKELLDRADVAASRIEQGIALLGDPQCQEAFKIANRAMAVAAQRRQGVMLGKDPATIAPTWRPFQLAFILMNLPGISDPTHADRNVVDLLFFPTGGGKTEAYLGLAAFTLVLRRLRKPGITSAGLSVLMRYTLRLLTLDQLGRAATLICALELERQKDVEKLGEWPFEIALWVGKAATPNVMGAKGDGNNESARAKTIRLQGRRPQAVADPAGRMPLVRDQVQGQLVPTPPQSRLPNRPPHHLHETGLRVQPWPAAADPGRGRADLSPPAVFHDRHGG